MLLRKGMNSEKKIIENSTTNWERLEAMQDKDIDLSDIPEITEDQFKKAKIRLSGKPIQKDGNKEKPYQVRQVRHIILKYKPGEEINE